MKSHEEACGTSDRKETSCRQLEPNMPCRLQRLVKIAYLHTNLSLTCVMKPWQCCVLEEMKEFLYEIWSLPVQCRAMTGASPVLTRCCWASVWSGTMVRDEIPSHLLLPSHQWSPCPESPKQTVGRWVLSNNLF